MSQDEVATIMQAEESRYAAMLAGDTETLRSMAHPELTYAHSNGLRDDLEALLAKVGVSVVYHSIEHPIDRVLIAGDTAVVVGEMRASITSAGVDKLLDNTCIAVWARVGDQWRWLAYQPTPRP